MQAFEWVTINKSIQKLGFATCDVSNLLLSADELRTAGHNHAAALVASAVRDVLRHRQLARKHMAYLISSGTPARAKSQIYRVYPTYAERIRQNANRKRITWLK